MGHHINSNGDFQSDKHPDLPPNKIILSFKDPAARKALNMFAELTEDEELAEDIFTVLNKWIEIDMPAGARPSAVQLDHRRTENKSRPCGFGQT